MTPHMPNPNAYDPERHGPRAPVEQKTHQLTWPDVLEKVKEYQHKASLANGLGSRFKSPFNPKIDNREAFQRAGWDDSLDLLTALLARIDELDSKACIADQLLLAAYNSGHREGWEEGPSVAETMDRLHDYLAEHGLIE